MRTWDVPPSSLLLVVLPGGSQAEQQAAGLNPAVGSDWVSGRQEPTVLVLAGGTMWVCSQELIEQADPSEPPGFVSPEAGGERPDRQVLDRQGVEQNQFVWWPRNLEEQQQKKKKQQMWQEVMLIRGNRK